MNNLRVIFQVRLNSSRLPAKAMLNVRDLPAVILAVKRICNTGIAVLVATSTAPADDILCDVLDKYGIKYVRGPLDDVMQRYVMAAEGMDDDDIISRLTGDNLLLDGELVEKFYAEYLKSGRKYMATGWPMIDLPYGISLEFFRAGDLRKFAESDFSPYSREHVTPPFYQNDKNIYHPPRESITTKLPRGLKDLHCTMDTFEDYIRICRVFQKVDDPTNASWEDLCLALQEVEAAN